jgi:adenosylhomocysteine nucleosidase
MAARNQVGQRPGSEINIGVVASGASHAMVAGDAIGKKVDNLRQRQPDTHIDAQEQPADVGVLTVLTEEWRAVVEILKRHPQYRSEQLPGGQQVHRALVPAEGGDLRVVGVQTLDRGPESAGEAYRFVVETFTPSVVLLVGIAGGIRDGIQVGDVVIADEVIYYDPRRETSGGPQRRGRTQPMAPVLLHRVNEFFRRSSGVLTGPTGERIRIHRGPIGTGNAVITDAGADILSYLRRFNEKTLAVETEAGGVGQAFYERIDRAGSLRGWLTIRGISDLADNNKGHDHHQFAADRAALAMDRLLPLLNLKPAQR